MNLTAHATVPELITLPDIAVFFACMAATVASILWGHSIKNRNATGNEPSHVLEHLLMGRKLTLPLFIATLVASWYGGIFGVTEIAFNDGVYNFLTQGIFWYATYIIFAVFMVDKISAFNAVTLPELVSKMFGPRAGIVAAIFNFFNILPIAYSLSLGIFLQMLTGWSLAPSVALGTGLVCVYSMLGGFRSDVFSDLIQFVIMCSSVLMVVVFAFFTTGDFSYLKSQLPPTHFEPMGTHSLATTLVWGFIALATLVDPNFYQRCFAAEKPHIAKRGIIISTMIWCVFDLCTTLGGMYARAALPDADPKQGYLLFALQILPPGFRGFFLAGIVAIIISTLDSFLIIAAHTLSYDLVPKRFRHKIFLHRLSTVLVGVIAIYLSLIFDGSIKTIWKTLGSYSAGCLLLPMLIGYFRPTLINEFSFIIATALGAIGITYWRLTSHTGIWAEIDPLYAGLLCTFLGLVFAGFGQRLAVPTK